MRSVRGSQNRSVGHLGARNAAPGCSGFSQRAGLMTGSTDLNSATTTTTFDNIGRKTLVQVGAAIRDTNFIYNEPACTGTPCVVTSQTPVTVTTYRDLASTNDKGVVEISTLDQRGQTYLTQKS